MKISINGTIIDTKDIYQITPIINPTRLADDPEEDADNLREYCKHWFSVILFNNQRLDFCSYNRNNIQPKIVFKYARERIINAWNEDKTDIPQFNF